MKTGNKVEFGIKILKIIIKILLFCLSFENGYRYFQNFKFFIPKPTKIYNFDFEHNVLGIAVLEIQNLYPL